MLWKRTSFADFLIHELEVIFGVTQVLVFFEILISIKNLWNKIRLVSSKN